MSTRRIVAGLTTMAACTAGLVLTAPAPASAMPTEWPNIYIGMLGFNGDGNPLAPCLVAGTGGTVTQQQCPSAAPWAQRTNADRTFELLPGRDITKCLVVGRADAVTTGNCDDPAVEKRARWKYTHDSSGLHLRNTLDPTKCVTGEIAQTGVVVDRLRRCTGAWNQNLKVVKARTTVEVTPNPDFSAADYQTEVSLTGFDVFGEPVGDPLPPQSNGQAKFYSLLPSDGNGYKAKVTVTGDGEVYTGKWTAQGPITVTDQASDGTQPRISSASATVQVTDSGDGFTTPEATLSVEAGD